MHVCKHTYTTKITVIYKNFNFTEDMHMDEQVKL